MWRTHIYSLFRLPYIHARSILNTPRSLRSLLPVSVPSALIYSHRAVSGRLIKMLSIRAPGVIDPNFVPRSCTRLNSTYRPLRSSCHRRSCSVLGVRQRRSRIGRYDGTNGSPAAFTNAKISSCDTGLFAYAGTAMFGAREVVVEDPADPARFAAVGDAEVLVAPFLQRGVDGFAVGVTGRFERPVEVLRVFVVEV